jgi:hypothetical protein
MGIHDGDVGRRRSLLSTLASLAVLVAACGGGTSSPSVDANGVTQEPDVDLPGEPAFMAVNPTTGLLYVTVTLTTTNAGAIVVVDTTSGAITATIDLPTGLAATAIAVDSSTNTIYAACYSNTSNGPVVVVDGATNTVTGMITGLPVKFLEYLAVDTSSHAVYGYNGSMNLSVMDGTAKSFVTAVTLSGYGTTLSAPDGLLTVDPATHTVYVLGAASSSGSLLSRVDGTTNTFTTSTPYTGTPVQATWDARDNGVLVVTQNPQTAVLDGPLSFMPDDGYTIASISDICNGYYNAVIEDGAGNSYFGTFDAMGKQVGKFSLPPGNFVLQQAVSLNSGLVWWGTTTITVNGVTMTVAKLKRFSTACP